MTRTAGRPLISVRLAVLLVAIFAFPWALPALLLIALGLATLVVAFAGAAIYAVGIVLAAHLSLMAAAAGLAAALLAVRALHRLSVLATLVTTR